jgi:glucose/arabinose dehydrogenase
MFLRIESKEGVSRSVSLIAPKRAKNFLDGNSKSVCSLKHLLSFGSGPRTRSANGAPSKQMQPKPRFHVLAYIIASSALVLAIHPNAGAAANPANAGVAPNEVPDGPALIASTAFPVIQIDPRFRIEKIAEGLTYTTSMAWDDQGRMYVLEAGGGFTEEKPPARILRVEPNGSLTEVVNLETKGVAASAVGLAFYKGAFYVSHRDARDRSGAVSRVTLDGTVTQILSGLVDSQAEHQVNDLRVGPDGRMYLAAGPATNSGVVGIDLAPFVSRSPMLHHRPCQNIVLTGQNFETPDFRTKDDPSDLARTGAFVPFGTETTPGQVIPGVKKCGGAIFTFDPNNAEATLQPYATGFRNIIGFAWDGRGDMFAAVNGYDIRGSRPVNDKWDATYHVHAGTWYGWPDFSATLEPLTDPKFDSPKSLKAPVYVNGKLQGKPLNFLIDHAASGLNVADKSLIHGLHEINSSPSLVDVAPASWGELAGQVFTAEWGDLAPATTPLRDGFAGFMISRLNPAASQERIPFVRNAKRGPASAQDALGKGIERPFGVRFGPDGAMYITDYGAARVNRARTAQGQVPYEFPPQTGAIWKVTKVQ